ncbi:MAG: hypothetical protein ABSG86_30965 [Thermoguttaceae bacterium]
MNISLTTVVLSAELPAEKAVSMGPCGNAGQPNEVPVVVGYADDGDEDEEEDDEEAE